VCALVLADQKQAVSICRPDSWLLELSMDPGDWRRAYRQNLAMAGKILFADTQPVQLADFPDRHGISWECRSSKEEFRTAAAVEGSDGPQSGHWHWIWSSPTYWRGGLI